MAKNSNKKTPVFKRKKTNQGDGKFSKAAHTGGETYFQHIRAGSPPSKFRRKKKPYRGQGK
tara:strand:+ start:3892 stop:4074 length:183 start_codon:yes stop_codon:yes gene_type:complete